MIKEVLIVEGRSDVARIKASHIDVDMITTDGFSLRPDTLARIDCAYKKEASSSSPIPIEQEKKYAVF